MEMKSQQGWTFVELMIAMFILTLLITMIYPLLTVFKSSHVEKATHMTGLMLAQGEIERQLAITDGTRQSVGYMEVEQDTHTYVIDWKRIRHSEVLDLLDVRVTWYVGDKKRQLIFERYVTVE